MYYYKFTANTPYCETESRFYEEYENRPSDYLLEETANEYARENGEGYEYLIFGWGYDPVKEGEMTEAEYQAEIDDYYADCYCEFEEISEEEYYENV